MYKKYKIRGKDLYRVVNTETKEVKSEGSTLEDAKKQIRLLNSLEKKEKKEKNGGSLKASQIKKAVELSYNNKKEDAPKGYEIDKELSDGRVKVYKDINSPQTLVVHRGSKGTRDWLDNVRYGLTGQTTSTDTFKKHEKKHKKAIQKYGAENIIAIGHSRAGMYVQELNDKKPVKEVITYNKASCPSDIFRKNPKNQTDVRTSIDVVSALAPLQSHENKIITVPSNTLNPLTAHSAEPLGKLGDKLLGSGIDNLKKMKVAEMKKIIKAFKKANNEKWNGSKVKKNELVDIIKNQILKHSQDKNDNQIHPCWPGYEQYGMKMKNNKQVPNCIPTGGLLEKSNNEDEDLLEKSDDEDLLEKSDDEDEDDENICIRIEIFPKKNDELVGGANKWTNFVKLYSEKHGTSYGCSLTNPKIKKAYKNFKYNKKWYYPDVTFSDYKDVKKFEVDEEEVRDRRLYNKCLNLKRKLKKMNNDELKKQFLKINPEFDGTIKGTNEELMNLILRSSNCSDLLEEDEEEPVRRKKVIVNDDEPVRRKKVIVDDDDEEEPVRIKKIIVNDDEEEEPVFEMEEEPVRRKKVIVDDDDDEQIIKLQEALPEFKDKKYIPIKRNW